MVKFLLNCVALLVLATHGFSLPQGHRGAQQEQLHQQHLDPTAIDNGMNQEHAKLVQNLQRLKRTLEHVKERVGKGTYGETAKVDMKNPEGAILTVLKSLQEQGQLFSMINDMLKAGSQVQNQTARIQAYSDLKEQAQAEASIADRTNHIDTTNAPPAATPSETVVPAISTSTRRSNERHHGQKDVMSKQHGYGSDDYQYQYRDDSKDATGDDQYDYHYDASGFDDTPRVTTTTTTTTQRPGRRVRTRGRNDYY